MLLSRAIPNGGVWLFSCLVVWFFAVRSGRAERCGDLVVWLIGWLIDWFLLCRSTLVACLSKKRQRRVDCKPIQLIIHYT